MILPRLCINGSRYRVELYYPEELFSNMLYMALENYDDGYDIGYNDAIKDREGGEFDVEV